MSDIPNPIAAFEIFSKKEKKQQPNKRTSLKKLSKKLAKRLFGKNLETLDTENTPEWYKIAVKEIGVKEIVVEERIVHH